ncbi:MAG: protein kinase [Acidobacteriota bacterium]
MPEDLSVETLTTWLTQPPGLYIVAGLGVLLLAFTVWLLAFRRSGVPAAVRREIAVLESEGSWRAAGVRWEEIGQHKRALDAYRQGKAHLEAARLLKRLGRLAEARKEARAGRAWSLYAEIAEAAGDAKEAAAAWKHAGQPFPAARAFEKAGAIFEAADCYIAAGEADRALTMLGQENDPRVAKLIEKILRADLIASGPKRTKAVEHAVQLFGRHDDHPSAFRLALDEDRLDLALPIAREHLEPSRDVALAFERGDDPQSAAEIYEALGDTAQAALLRGDAYAARDDHASAAAAYEEAGAWPQAAELWVVAGDLPRAAEAWEKVGSWERAATLWGRAGDAERQQAARAKVVEEETQWGNRSGTYRAPDPSRLTVPGAPQPIQTAPQQPAPVQAVPQQPAVPQHAQTALLGRDHTADAGFDAQLTTGAENPTAMLDHPGPGHATPSEPTSKLQGGDISRYEVRGELGRGGMGVVYRAWDHMLERPVAYKVLHDGEAGDIDALLAEARAAARLSHPNIVTVYDAGKHSRGAFIVMELIEGKTFSELLANKRLNIGGAVRVAQQICSALGHAHGKRLVHRDLKPSNLLWLAEERRVKLTDFGLARGLEASGAVMTHAAGTPSYMAPEQIKAEAVDPRTDIYSLGCVLFEMLTGAPPFPRASSLYHHLSTEPTDPRDLRPEIPEPLAKIVLHCMQKAPAKRPQSTHEIDSVLATL